MPLMFLATEGAKSIRRKTTAPAGIGGPPRPMSGIRATLPTTAWPSQAGLPWPISSSMPATGQNPRLMKFAGQKLIASGTLFERGGSRALVIEKIEAAPAVK